MSKILLAWLGQADLDCAAGRKKGPGPTASVVAARAFDALVLLSNYPEDVNRAYVDWLEGRNAPRIHLRTEHLADPTDYAGIHDAVVRCMVFVKEEFDEDADLAIHISPGTPAMQAVWVLLAKTRYPAELIQSHERTGVRTVSIPFDISADFIPDLLNRPDEKLERLSQGLPAEAPEFDDIIRRSPAMERAVARARKGAPRRVPILLEGESGTGKELFAKAIHAASPRAGRPFVPVNCGAIPKELVESELFGHKKGAFTGAHQDRNGKFEEADGGTIFLDEVGEVPLEAQVKLLRVLEDRCVTPVGGTKSRELDIRVVSATNRDLLAAIREGRFREDLYHRLAVGVIRLPPLRERQGDISLLIDHFLGEANREAADQPGFQEKKLSAGARNLLLGHPWPGNVRELRNTLLRLCIWSPGETIGVEDVRDELGQTRPGTTPALLDQPLGEGLKLPDLMAELARHYLERALLEAGGNKTTAAKLVGLPSYQTFTNWMARYAVKEPRKARNR